MVQPSLLPRLAHSESIRGVWLFGFLFTLLFATVLSPCGGFAQAESGDEDIPLLRSVFPLAGQRGSTFNAEMSVSNAFLNVKQDFQGRSDDAGLLDEDSCAVLAGKIRKEMS